MQIAAKRKMNIKESNKSLIRNNITGYLLIGPWLLGFLILNAGPMIASVFLSLTKYDYITKIKWVGFDNYIKIFTKDIYFWNSIYVTFKYVLIREPIMIVCSIFIALLLDKIVRGSGFYRTLFYLPTIVGGGVATSVMWFMILSKDGMLNKLLALVGIPAQSWLHDPALAFGSLVGISLYHMGRPIIIFLAGFKNVPNELYEAATIDGAGSVKKFIKITLPMLSPVIFFNFIMGVIHGFKAFTNAFIITKGGPLGTTSFYMLNLYDQAFRYQRAGYASALAWILFIIILVFTMLVFKSSNLWVFYETNIKDSKKDKE